MKKSILNFGKALNRTEQKKINGGTSEWGGFCFPSQGKCNYYCSGECSPCGVTSSFGYTPHLCVSNEQQQA